MPGVMPVYDPKAKDDDERKERNQQIDQYWQLRDGDHTPPLKVKPGDMDDNIIMNVCGQVIDDIVEFLGVPELKPEGSDNDIAALLSEVSESNDFASMTADTIESGLIAGHVFMRIADDQGSPMIAPLDPRFVSVFWDITRPGLRRALLWHRITWQVEETTYRQDIVPDYLVNSGGETIDPRDNTGYQIIQYVKGRMKNDFTLEGVDRWDYPFSPIVDWKNRRRPHQYYGWSELAQAKGLQQGINFVASNTGRIIKFHAHPKTIITGADVNELHTGPDGLFSFPDPDVKVNNLEMQSDLKSSMGYLDKLEQRFFAERRVVDPAQVKDKVGALTNFGLQVMYLNMLKLIQEKQELYGAGIAETMRRALILIGRDVQLTTSWRDPLPVNRLELVNAAAQESDIGTTSKETLAGDMGRDYEVEKKRLEEEQAAKIDQSVATMERMGTRGLFGQPGNSDQQQQQNGQNGQRVNG